MYSDHSLLPKEALRLAILGMLAEGERGYADLAADVRRFVSRLAGPSLDLMGSSLELLRYEELIAPACGAGDDARLALTTRGRAELDQLLRAPLRPRLDDVGRLVLALKMRFLHLLPPAAQREQAEMAIEACRGELARLEDLGRGEGGEAFAAWLAHDTAQAEARLAWLARFRESLPAG